MRTEWVIHIWGKKRDNLELTSQEKFHMDMIIKCKNDDVLCEYVTFQTVCMGLYW